MTIGLVEQKGVLSGSRMVYHVRLLQSNGEGYDTIATIECINYKSAKKLAMAINVGATAAHTGR